MSASFQTTFSNAFLWMKMYEFQLIFQFFPKCPICNIPAFVHLATSHYMNQMWWNYRRIYASRGLNELSWWSVAQLVRLLIVYVQGALVLSCEWFRVQIFDRTKETFPAFSFVSCCHAQLCTECMFPVIWKMMTNIYRATACWMSWWVDYYFLQMRLL